MNRFFLKLSLLIAAIVAMPEAISAAGKCDLIPWMIKSPCACSRLTQGLVVNIYNAGDAPSGAYTVGIKLDGVLVGENHFDDGIELWGERDITLDGTVTLEYGKTYQVEAYVETDEPDANTSNNAISSTFTMPDAPESNYPFIWNDATCQQDFTYDSGGWSVAWGFSNEMNAFYISERASNWFGSLSTTKPITFNEGDVVTCSFDYGTSGAPVKLTLAEKGQYSSQPFAEKVLPESIYDFSHATISFVAPGPMTVDFYPELQADFYTYGSFYIRNICFTPAEPDMETTTMLSPQFSNLAASSAPVDVVVRYTNNGAFDITSPKLSYQYGDQVVTETYDGVIAAGKTLDYRFSTPIVADAPADDVKLMAWCEADGDSDASNDKIVSTLSIYKPLGFPYTTDFTNNTIDLWSTLDLDGNDQSWSFDQVGQYHGPVLMCDYGKFDDVLVMPAIEMPEGKARLTFGYWNTYAAARLKVLMGRTPSLSEMTEVLCDINNQNGIEGFGLIDVKEPGLYYIAFEGIGSADQLLITDVKLDAGNGIVTKGIGYDAISGYSLTTSPVTIKIENHGVSEQNDISVYYGADTHELVTEVIDQTLQPGESMTYTFKQVADVSTFGIHTIYGGVKPKEGEDDNYFTSMTGAEITNREPLQAPYSYGFGDDERNKDWTLQSDGEYMGDGWNLEEGNFSANSNHTDIIASFSGWGSNSRTADYWAFSEGVYLEPGDYEVAFYYRGRSYFGGADYVQDMDVALGQGNNAEAMTIPVASFRDLDSHGCYFDRHVAYVTIPEAGAWNLGFHDMSVANYGQLRIDDVSIRAIEPGLPLPYRSDFSDDAEAQWTFHGNETWGATQWSYDNGTLTCTHDGYDGAFFENITTSPKLNIVPGQEVTVHIEYNVNRLQGLSPDLNVYMGKFDSMQQMDIIATLPANKNEAEFTFTAAEEGGVYLGIRSATDISEEDSSYDGPLYSIKIKSVEVSYTQPEAINVMSADDAPAEYYNLMGQRTGKNNRGMTIVRRNGAPAKKVMK